MREKPNYYSVIPASVRYNKKLKSIEKILYAEITSLCNAYGYCFATNQYFAEVYDVDSRSIRRYLNHLSECGFITIEFEQNNYRKIYLCDVSPELGQILENAGIADDNTDISDTDIMPSHATQCVVQGGWTELSAPLYL